jgi:hypothetical protein
MTTLSSWQFWAVLSAVFAALTAIFAKVGVENIGSDLATFIRTIVVIVTLGFLLAITGQFQAPGTISGRTYSVPAAVGAWHRRVVAVLFPRAQTRAGGAGRADRQALGRACGAVRSRVPWREAYRAELVRRRADCGGGGASGLSLETP